MIRLPGAEAIAAGARAWSSTSTLSARSLPNDCSKDPALAVPSRVHGTLQRHRQKNGCQLPAGTLQTYQTARLRRGQPGVITT